MKNSIFKDWRKFVEMRVGEPDFSLEGIHHCDYQNDLENKIDNLWFELGSEVAKSQDYWEDTASPIADKIAKTFLDWAQERAVKAYYSGFKDAIEILTTSGDDVSHPNGDAPIGGAVLNDPR